MIIQFEMEHCPSCRKLKAMLDKFGLGPDQTVIYNDNDAETVAMVEKFKVQSFPTLLSVDESEDYKEDDRITGLPSLSRLKAFFALDD